MCKWLYIMHLLQDKLRHAEASLKDQVFQNSLLARRIEVGMDHVQLLKVRCEMTFLALIY